MSLISVKGVHKYFGATPILTGISINLDRGDRVGLIGRNGTGKTTLLGILAGREDYEQGDILLAAGLSLGYLTQGVDLPAQETVWQAAGQAMLPVLKLEQELRRLELLMGEEQVMADEGHLAKVMARYTHLSTEYERLDGYGAHVRVATVLNGLQMPEATWNLAIERLSGGQRTRVALARLLLEEPELLFLDEPTNHLDVAAISWLEEHLSSYEGALLVVSHDREFLDRVVTRIWELEDHELYSYLGNYSSYVQQKEAANLRARALQKEQARKREQLTRLVAKFKAGTRATAAKSWEKRLARMDSVVIRRSGKIMRLSTEVKRRSGNEVLQLRGLTKAYPGKALFRDFSAKVRMGERIALVGPNGCGKTTLLKILLGDVLPDAGSFRWGASIDFGYFSQDLKLPESETTVLDTFSLDNALEPAEARNYLARFLFTGDAVFQSVSSLSGGERNRLALARLLVRGANVLLLDEPTNHLDIKAREALEELLATYTGTLFLVSHDRYFLKNLATRIWHFDAGTVHDFPGDYASFIEHSAQVQSAAKEAAKTKTAAPTPGKTIPTKTETKDPYADLALLEEKITALEAERDHLYAAMADPALYKQGGGRQTVEDCRRVEADLARLYQLWEKHVEH